MKSTLMTLAAIGLLTASCSSSTSNTANGSAAESCCAAGAANALIGHWRITEACGLSTEGGDEPATISFDDSLRVNGCATVNLFFGDYRLSGDTLLMDHVGMTRKMGQSMTIEAAVTDGINRALIVGRDGSSVTLADSTGIVVLRLEPAEKQQ